jgi:hypothetical protein
MEVVLMAEDDQKVRVLSKDERNAYDGMTIDETTGQPGDTPREQEAPQFQYRRTNERVRHSGFSIHTLGWKDLLFGNTSWMTRIALLVGFLAIMGVVLLFVVPTVLTIVGIGLVVWLVMQFFLNL